MSGAIIYAFWPKDLPYFHLVPSTAWSKSDDQPASGRSAHGTPHRALRFPHVIGLIDTGREIWRSGSWCARRRNSATTV